MEELVANSAAELLNREVLRDVRRSWDRFKEPLKLRALSKYATRFKKIGSSVTDFCWTMHEQGLVRMAENVNAQLFVYPIDVYIQASEEERKAIDDGFGPGMPDTIYPVGRPSQQPEHQFTPSMDRGFVKPQTTEMDAFNEKVKRIMAERKAKEDAERESDSNA